MSLSDQYSVSRGIRVRSAFTESMAISCPERLVTRKINGSSKRLVTRTRTSMISRRVSSIHWSRPSIIMRGGNVSSSLVPASSKDERGWAIKSRIGIRVIARRPKDRPRQRSVSTLEWLKWTVSFDKQSRQKAAQRSIGGVHSEKGRSSPGAAFAHGRALRLSLRWRTFQHQRRPRATR